MRPYRQIFAIIILFCVFFELCEPSTNFIRTSVTASSEMPSSDGSDQDHSPALKDFGTHAAQIAGRFIFEVTDFYSPVYIDHYKESPLNGYCENIFQPPKQS